jgi:crossover junction endodeoxyribonuclease RusA
VADPAHCAQDVVARMIELPFPPSKLSPNGRHHWAVRARAFKTYKTQCAMLLSQFRRELSGRNSFELRFIPPDRHRRDIDNMLAASKAAIDALSEICGVDDSQFQLTISRGEPRKGGAVVIV